MAPRNYKRIRIESVYRPDMSAILTEDEETQDPCIGAFISQDVPPFGHQHDSDGDAHIHPSSTNGLEAESTPKTQAPPHHCRRGDIITRGMLITV
jgi:hypothetical protein